tara:strand:+ start:636 stop:1055 length:420 start_codon:yes stop_codon:yes gene_type:complete
MKFQLPENMSHAYRIITELTNTINQKDARITELTVRRDLQKQDFDERISELEKDKAFLLRLGEPMGKKTMVLDCDGDLLIGLTKWLAMRDLEQQVLALENLTESMCFRGHLYNTLDIYEVSEKADELREQAKQLKEGAE